MLHDSAESFAFNDSSLVPSRPAQKCRAAPSLLYIGDDWEHLSEQCAILESAGYRVEATDSPAAGLSSYVRNDFHAVILDFDLPFLSNTLLADVMRRFRENIPFILISDRVESAETELGALCRQIPRHSSQRLFLANLAALIDCCHEPNQVSGIMNFLDSDVQV